MNEEETWKQYSIAGLKKILKNGIEKENLEI